MIYSTRTQRHSPATEEHYSESYTSPRQTLRAEHSPVFSFVIPAMNEASTLEELLDGIYRNTAKIGHFEVIFIDDGSTDDSWEVIQALADLFPQHVRGLSFRGNRGKAAALQAGFDAARGQVIFTMDADLQDDPAEIPRFLQKLDEGYDLVSGWKEVRHDPWHKVFPSRIFNRMLSYISGVKLHDHNCGFKCFRREVAKSIRLFGELHRMVPSLAGMQGFRVSEIVVRHHPRKFGISKYGMERYLRGFSDMLTVGFLRKFRERPSHFANFCGAAYAAIGAGVVGLGLCSGFSSMTCVLCSLVGLSFAGMSGACILAGLFTELLIRQPHNIPSAVVDDTRTSPEPSRSSPSAETLRAAWEFEESFGQTLVTS